MEGMAMAPPQQSSSNATAMAPGGMPRRMHMGGMHMTFFWGEEAQILFTGWPGHRGLGAYLLALLFVFVLAALVESLSYTAHRLASLTRAAAGGGSGGARGSSVSAGAAQTVIHALRVGLAYVVMLAVMSFNGGVLLAAVAGHALGYFFLGSGAFRRGAHDGPIIEDKC